MARVSRIWASLLIEGRSRRAKIDLVADEYIIGSSSAADLRIDEPTVSQRHARIRRTAGGIEITDLNSLNGTRLNGRNLHASSLVPEHSTIQLGAVRIQVLQPRTRMQRLARRTAVVALYLFSVCLLGFTIAHFLVGPNQRGNDHGSLSGPTAQPGAASSEATSTEPSPDVSSSAASSDPCGDAWAEFETKLKQKIAEGTSEEDARIDTCGDLTRLSCALIGLGEGVLAAQPDQLLGKTPAEKHRLEKYFQGVESLLVQCQRSHGCEAVNCSELSP
jgi:hypothetical protein